MTDRAELATAIQNLRAHCNVIIGDANVLGANNVPGFHTINELLKRCDAVFRAFNTDVTLDRASAGEGGAADDGPWSLSKFFREEEHSFGFEADTESMSPEQAAITLMRRLRRQLNEARSSTPAPQAPFSINADQSVDISGAWLSESVGVETIIAAYGPAYSYGTVVLPGGGYSSGDHSAYPDLSIPIVTNGTFPVVTNGDFESPITITQTASPEVARDTGQAPGEERLREFAASVFEQHGFVHNARILRGSPDAVWVVAFMEILRRLSPSADLLAAAKEILPELDAFVKAIPPYGNSEPLKRFRTAIRNAGGE